MDVVRWVDTKEKSCMGYIYDAMIRAKEQISKNLKGGPNARLVSRFLSMIQTRWIDQLHHPLHIGIKLSFINLKLFVIQLFIQLDI